jgi:tetratricopeptide (TPR) repeat protein
VFRRGRNGIPAPVDVEAFTPPSLSDEVAEYVRASLEPSFHGVPEPRTWREPSLRGVVDALNAGRYQEAERAAERIIRRFADLHLGYVWLSDALQGEGQIDQARTVLLQGLQLARSKHSICRVLGEIELHAGNLEGAVYWWAQSVHSRERLQPVDVEVEAYLYLSVVAGAISGLHDIASALEGKVDAARGGGIRLNPGASSDLRSLVYESPPKPQRDAIGEVLRGLSEHYLRDEMDARREREERLNRETRDFYLREHQRKKEHKKRPRPGATAPGI